MWGIAALLPAVWASKLASALLGWLGPYHRKHKHILRNLAVAQPSASINELENLAQGVWRNLGAVLFEYPHLRHIYQRGGTLDVAPAAAALFEKEQPVMLATGHLANWEVMGLVMSNLSKHMTVVYGPQDNELINRMIQWFRGRGSACVWVEKQNALRAITKRSLQGGSVGLLPDIRVDSGMLLPFFELDAPTTISPARLALRLGYPMVPARIKRLGPARFEVEILSTLESKFPGTGKLAAVDLIEQYNKILEDWISVRPEVWLCSKRRWPKTSATQTAN